MEWLRYLRNSIGFDGWRFDFVRGWPGHFAKQASAGRGFGWCMALRQPLSVRPVPCPFPPPSPHMRARTLSRAPWSPASAPPQYIDETTPEMAFGEYWDSCDYSDGVLNYNQDKHRCACSHRRGAHTRPRVRSFPPHTPRAHTTQQAPLPHAHVHTHAQTRADALPCPCRQQTVNWCDQTGGTASAFDFTTKGILQEAVRGTWQPAQCGQRPQAGGAGGGVGSCCLVCAGRCCEGHGRGRKHEAQARGCRG